jgi:hypothetical protein
LRHCGVPVNKPNPYRQQPPENTATNSSAAKVYTASPTLTRLHESRKVVKYVEGPVNSGKSTGCILEVIMRALRQAPGTDNVRRSRWAIVRNSYPELKSTTIKSWEMWVPPHVAPVVYSSPIQCNFKQNLADGTRMELEVIFLAMDHPDDAARVLSMELTGVYINEGKEIGWELFEAIKGRTDRYPQFEILDDGTHVGGASEPGMVVDSNPPHISHWLYEKFETGAVPDGWEKFQQPPAVYWDEATQDWVLNPDRENQRFTKPDYYTNQLKGAEETYVRVMLAGEYGASRRGKPVFSLYSEAKHVAKAKLDPDRQWPLIVGLDFGLNPGCVVGQLTRRGIRITDEVPTSDESLEDFLETYLVPLLAKRYPGYPVTIAGDPAGRGRSANDKRTSFDILSQFGLKGFPAYTNNFQVRKETVDHYLRRDEGLIISPHCVHIREAMATGYVWKESRNSKGASLDVPDKNEFSHVADALQYVALWAKYGYRPQPVRERGAPKKTMMV